MAGKPPLPVQEGHRAAVGGHLPVDSGPRQTGAALHPTRQPRLPEEGDAKSAQVCRPVLLSATSGHAATGSFLHDRMSGPQRLETDECGWCNSGRRQSRYHLFTECRAWAPQIRGLWRKVGKDCGWEHPRAPALRWLWKDDAVGALVELLENTRVGSRASARARVDEGRDGDEVPGQEDEEDGPGPPWAVFFCPFLCRALWEEGERVAPV